VVGYYNPTTKRTSSFTLPAGDNPLQMVSMISPSGVLYQGTYSGLLRVRAIVPEPSTWVLGLAGIACGGWWTWRAASDVSRVPDAARHGAAGHVMPHCVSGTDSADPG